MHCNYCMIRDSTLHDLQYGLNKGHIVTELDPDCRVRQKKRLSELDEVITNNTMGGSHFFVIDTLGFIP